MKLKILLITLVLPASLLSFSQSAGSDSLSKAEIKKLGFMTGKWSGKALTLGLDGQKTGVELTQEVAFMNDSTALLIDRKGMLYGQIIHNELAIITYNKQDSAYTFYSFLASGERGIFKAVLDVNRFYWYPYDNIRYAITINEKGKWSEIGQMRKQDEAIQFIEIAMDEME